jgi:hypothetical protein
MVTRRFVENSIIIRDIHGYTRSKRSSFIVDDLLAVISAAVVVHPEG